jgi:hypothetical protein
VPADGAAAVPLGVGAIVTGLRARARDSVRGGRAGTGAVAIATVALLAVAVVRLSSL